MNLTRIIAVLSPLLSLVAMVVYMAFRAEEIITWSFEDQAVGALILALNTILVISGWADFLVVTLILSPFFSLVWIVGYMTFRINVVIGWPIAHQVVGIVVLVLTIILVITVCYTVYNHFMTVPDNWAWAEAAYYANCSGWIGDMLTHMMQSMYTGGYKIGVGAVGLVMLVGGFIGVILTGVALPCFVLISCVYSIAGIIYAFAWFTQEPNLIFKSIDPFDKLK